MLPFAAGIMTTNTLHRSSAGFVRRSQQERVLSASDLREPHSSGSTNGDGTHTEFRVRFPVPGSGSGSRSGSGSGSGSRSGSGRRARVPVRASGPGSVLPHGSQVTSNPKFVGYVYVIVPTKSLGKPSSIKNPPPGPAVVLLLLAAVPSVAPVLTKPSM